MSLGDWLQNSWLVEHRTSRKEIFDLLLIADRDLNDCLSPGLSPEWKLNIAYNAALQLSTAALSACGYRATRDSHHYRVIQSLALTIEADKVLIDQLDKFRKKRNISEYERIGMVSDQEADEMIALSGKLQQQVQKWIANNYPELK